MQSVDTLKSAEGAVVAVRGRRKQDDYPYENTHEVHRNVCPVIAKAEFRVKTPHNCELWSSCLPQSG